MKKHLSLIILLGVVIFLACLCFKQLFPSSLEAHNFYQQGLSFLEKEDYQNAYYNFSKIKTNAKIYPLALYRQAFCAEKLNDYSSSAIKYMAFEKKHPNSIFAARALYESAKAHIKLKDYTTSEMMLKKIQSQYTDTDYAIGANYFLGIIYKEKAKIENEFNIYTNNTEQDAFLFDLPTQADNYNQKIIATAVDYWFEYLELCPSCRYSKDCINNIVNYSKKIPDNKFLKLGLAYYQNGNYLKAFEFLNKEPNNSFWDYRYLAAYQSGDKNLAKNIFEANFIKYSRTTNVSNLEKIIDLHLNDLTETEKKDFLIKLLDLSKNYRLSCVDVILFKLANLSDEENKIAYYKNILQQYPRSKYIAEISWFIFRKAYKDKDFDLALNVGERYIASSSANDILKPAMLFWLGKIYHHQKNMEKAKHYYQKLLKEFPDDYYSFRAASMYKMKHLNWHKNHSTSVKLNSQLSYIGFPFEFANLVEKDKNFINMAFNLGDYDIVDDMTTNSDIVKSWINYKNKNYTTSSVLARDWLVKQQEKPSFKNSAYLLAYPLIYSDLINKYSEKLNLDAFLMISLMKEESYFNPNAKSLSDARGLMQLMPLTAQYIADLQGISFDVNKLYEPDYNIELGCNYFKYIKQKLKNSNVLAVAAYNGGPNAVDYWVNNKEYADFDEFVEAIPYPETKNYVKKIYKSYWNYMNIYN